MLFSWQGLLRKCKCGLIYLKILVTWGTTRCRDKKTVFTSPPRGDCAAPGNPPSTRAESSTWGPSALGAVPSPEPGQWAPTTAQCPQEGSHPGPSPKRLQGDWSELPSTHCSLLGPQVLLLMASFSSLLLNILYVRYPDVNETEGVCSLFCVSSTLSAGMLFLPCISRYSVVGAISGYTVYMALNQPPDLSQRHEHSPGDTDTVFMP